ncbi:caspase recruitment domain-containing protein 8-like [Sardina pilchardus]|uniref:caspase recruitment domain-containing protein 8-like n=1 Tax=Sardina pilchardus TaxID=27697 RepID=UPI002E0EEEED
MADTLRQILLELSDDELEDFKFYLTKQDKPIPRGKHGTTVIQLVQSMERVYTEQGSIVVALQILEKMDFTQIVEKYKQHNESVPGPSQDQGQSNLNFFSKHKATLEKRMPILGNVLNQLEADKVLDAEERETVEAEQISVKRNRALIVMLDRKGEKAQEKFYQILKKTDPHLVEDLES